MKDLLEFALSEILGPNVATLTEHIEPTEIVYTIHTDPNHVGLVIGKGGKTIHALRSLLRMKAILLHKRARLELAPQD